MSNAKKLDLVDGLRLLDLDLRRGGVDGVGDVRLEGDHDPAPIRNALAEAVVLLITTLFNFFSVVVAADGGTK